MPLLFVVVMAVLVNFPSFVQAQETSTRIRGPRSSDTPPLPQTIGPLSSSDTLWRVADRIKPDNNISLYQVMYALYLKNPDAFLENNLNHLRPGAILLLPSLKEIQQVDLNIARQKSEQDDREWAARQKAAAAKTASAKAAAKSTSQSTPQWQAELARIGQQQRQDLDGLRSQFADSMQQVEAIALENLQLKTSLAKVEQQLAQIQAQLGEDSEIQQQISLLLNQQAELLQAKAAAEAAAKEQADWTQSFKSPLAWVLAACIPALLILFSILLWVKKRSRQTEQVINAATTEPASNPAYHSPLPPLDDSNDLDDSLFEIDDALLEDAFSGSAQTDEVDLTDDALDFDDALSFEDDSLLPPETLAGASETAEPDDAFDPDNILSDTDLSALLAAEDDDAAIIELADDNLAPDDIDQIEPEDLAQLDEAWPESELATAAEEPVQTETTGIEVDDVIANLDEFDIDELIEEIDLDEPDEPATLPVTPLQQEPPRADESDTTTAGLEQDDALADVTLESVADDFDGSELEEFAETLAAENSVWPPAEAADMLDNNEEALLSAELTELLDQVEESDENLMPEPAVDELELSEPIEQTTAGAEQDDDILLIDSAEPDSEDNALTSLDLSDADDDSVVRPNEAAMSVENPSKMLDQYPDLELSEADIASDDADLLQMPELEPELLMQDLAQSDNDNEETTSELDPLPDTQFDSLMSELEAMADNLDVDEHQQQADDNATDSTQTTESIGTDFDFSDDDFVEIDSLLASAEQKEQDSERFNQLNVDVGLDDYADIIGEHERRDVDTEDNGYSAKLDLVRAYIEIDDFESADLLLDGILASDAPENIKTEAKSLKR